MRERLTRTHKIFLFVFCSLYSLSAYAEPVKTRFNPFTNRLDFITEMDVNFTTGPFYSIQVTSNTVLSGVTYYWPASDGSANQRLTTGGTGVLTWETVSGGGGSSGLDVQDGGSDIATDISTMNFTGAQFIIAESPAGTALVTVDPSSVTMLGPSIGSGEFDSGSIALADVNQASLDAHYVTTATAQDVSGVKTFTSSLTVTTDAFGVGITTFVVDNGRIVMGRATSETAMVVLDDWDTSAAAPNNPTLIVRNNHGVGTIATFKTSTTDIVDINASGGSQLDVNGDIQGNSLTIDTGDISLPGDENEREINKVGGIVAIDVFGNTHRTTFTVQNDGSFDVLTQLDGPLTITEAGAITASNSTMTIHSVTISSIATLSGLDCSSNSNGGALTVDGSGIVVCSDDDSGAAGGGDQNPILDVDVDGSDFVTDIDTMSVTGTHGLVYSSASAVFSWELDASSVTMLGGTIESSEVTDGTLTADDLGTDSVSADELNATGVEAELEAVLDLDELQGQIGDAQIAAGAVDGGSGGEIQDNTVDANDIDETDDYTWSGAQTFTGSFSAVNSTGSFYAINVTSGILWRDTTYFIQSGAGSANQVLHTDGAGNLTWDTDDTGSATPGGADTQVQFNDGGSFGGDAGFTYDKTNNAVDVDSMTATYVEFSTAGKVYEIQWADGTVQVSSPVAGGGADTNAIKEIFFDAASMHPLETNFAVLKATSSAGGTIFAFSRTFDDTTRQYANFKWSVPTDVDTSATVTFRVFVMAETAASSVNVQLDFDHYCVNDSEAFQGSYTEESSGDFAIDATQGDVTEKTWTETITNLGWAANDLCYGRISRDPSAASDLTGDMHLFEFVIEVPRS